MLKNNVSTYSKYEDKRGVNTKRRSERRIFFLTPMACRAEIRLQNPTELKGGYSVIPLLCTVESKMKITSACCQAVFCSVEFASCCVCAYLCEHVYDNKALCTLCMGQREEEEDGCDYNDNRATKVVKNYI